MHTNSIWMKLLVLFSSISLFVSCSGGGGGAPPVPANEGSVANPVNLGTVSTTLTHAGSIADYGVSFYTFTTGPNSGPYVISLTSTQSDLSWALLSDPGFTTVIMECDNFILPGANDEICSFLLTAGTTYYLGVEEWDVVAGTYALGISVVSVPPGAGGGGGTPPTPANEGSVVNPVNLGTVSTTLTHAGSIADYGVSFYKFTTGPNSGPYVISLTSTQSDLSWALLSDPGFTTVIMECDNFIIPGTHDEICLVSLTAGTTYYMGVEEWDVVAGTYTLCITAPAPPATPTGVSTTAGSGKVTISWSAAIGATSYNVYWSTILGGALSGGTKISGITATSYDHNVPTTGIAYYYVVTAQNPYGESAKSSPEVNATVTPAAPRVVFVTSTSGNGNLGSWADAGGKSGLDAADAICQSRASAAGLTGNFTAWISDTSNDAYCRVNNLTGKKISNCGQPTLPAAAGPWVRTDGYPYSGNISELTGSGKVYAPARYDEYGTLIPGLTLYFTNTLFSGKADLPGGSTCGDWTTTNSSDYAGAGSSDVTAGLMYHTSCSNLTMHLLCMQTGDGPVLQNFATTGKKVFISSTNGTGNLASWPNAGGNTGIAAGDKVCQSLAANAGLANPANFKAWLSDSSTNAIDHITSNGSNGPWVRLDGVPIANNKNDLTDGSLFTSISLDDTGTYYREFINSYSVWTGTLSGGTLYANGSCNNWTDGTASYSGTFGQDMQAGAIWTEGYGTSCDVNNNKIYCFED